MELKPCPFCGQVPITWNAVNDLGESDTWIECNNNDCTHRDDLISLTDWQSRPIEDKLITENTAIQKAYAEANEKLTRLYNERDELRDALANCVEILQRNEITYGTTYNKAIAILAKQEGNK